MSFRELDSFERAYTFCKDFNPWYNFAEQCTDKNVNEWC